jgi:hypothetical protein
MRFSLRLLLSFTTAICLTLATWRGASGLAIDRWAWFPCYWIVTHFGVELLGYVLADLVGSKSIARKRQLDEEEARSQE